MPLSAGERLGPYEILALIGAGGMGEVYRARDPRLNRDVAIKVSHAEFSERFTREALAVAALNHPNICTLYDVGPNYLVMEYVEGSPIASVMARVSSSTSQCRSPTAWRRLTQRASSTAI
jgi:serine/threonine protein kinase